MGIVAENHKFLRDWKKHQTNIFTTMYPDLNKKDLSKFLDTVVAKRAINPPAKLHNNYVHKSVDVDLLGVIDWFHDQKPIAAGFGVFFKNQEQAKNPAAVMLDKFMILRKKYKSRLEDYDELSYEYATADRMQGTEKLNANSFYGASGAPTSNFFNLYTATAVTATGQSLISSTQQAFEAYLSNSVLFIDLDDCLTFLENIKKEKSERDDRFLPNVSVEKLMDRLKGMFSEYKESYEGILFTYLMHLPQRTINRMYFKNNLYDFSLLPRIRNIIMTIILKVEEFKNPNKVPDVIKSEMKILWDYYKEFVFHNYFPFDRIRRLKTEKRKTVVTVDTDSNMLNLDPWVVFLYRYFISVNDTLLKRNPDQLRFISINMMCYFITNMVTEALSKYTKIVNIPKDYRAKINMKNEFLFTRLILSPKKKRYISSVRLREGKEIYPEKVDIKGMDFIKSSTREETKQYFMKMVKDRLLNTKDIVISDILRDLENFEGIIMKSLQNGEKNFLIPKSVKELGGYKDPFKEQGVRAILAWNYLYPANSIELPEKVDIIKVLLSSPEEVEKVRDVDKKFYDIIMKNIFGNKEKKIADKGVQVIALPRNVERIPEWILPFIDYDTIVNDNVSRFYSVLESLGIQTLRTSKKEYFSNILTI